MWCQNHAAMAFVELVSSFRRGVIVCDAKPGLASEAANFRLQGPPPWYSSCAVFYALSTPTLEPQNLA